MNSDRFKYQLKKYWTDKQYDDADRVVEQLKAKEIINLRILLSYSRRELEEKLPEIYSSILDFINHLSFDVELLKDLLIDDLLSLNREQLAERFPIIHPRIEAYIKQLPVDEHLMKEFHVDLALLLSFRREQLAERFPIIHPQIIVCIKQLPINERFLGAINVDRGLVEKLSTYQSVGGLIKDMNSEADLEKNDIPKPDSRIIWAFVERFKEEADSSRLKRLRLSTVGNGASTRAHQQEEIDHCQVVDELVGPDLDKLPTLEELDVRLKRQVPPAYPVLPYFISFCHSTYAVQENKIPEIGVQETFQFLRASKSEAVSPSVYGISPLFWDWNKLVDRNKKSLRDPILPLIQLCLSFLFSGMKVKWPVVFSRGQSESDHQQRAPFPQERPDWRLHIRGFLVFCGKEMGVNPYEDIDTAVDGLVMAMDSWNPFFYGDLDFVFGYAVIGTRFQLYALHPNRSVLHPEGGYGVCYRKIGDYLDLGKLSGKFQLVQYMMNLAKVFKKMEESLPLNADDRPKLFVGNSFPWKRDGFGEYSRLYFYPRFVRKQLIPSPEVRYDFDLLKSLYEAVRTGRIKNTIQCAQDYPQKDVDGESIILHLYPLGRRDRHPKDNNELCTFTIDILEALESLHLAGFCHRDVRWPNIVQKVDEHWILIDLDFCARLGTNAKAEWPVWNNGVPERNGQEPWTMQKDLWQFSRIVKEINLPKAQQLGNLIENSPDASSALSSVQTFFAL